MHLAAAEPLYAAEHERTGAVETLDALVHARIAFRDDVAAFGRRVGFAPDVIDTWIKTGLVHHGTAIVHSTTGETKEIVAPSLLGARELARASGHAAKGLSSSRFKRSGRKLVHDATVGSVALTALAAARAGLLALKGVETDDKVLGTSAVVQDERGAATRVPLQPDGYVLTQSGDTLRGLLVEVDRGTTAAKRLGEKFRGYAAWSSQNGPERTFGVKAMRVVTLVPDERRLERLREVALEAVGRPSAMFLFALSSNVTPRDPEKLFEPIAKTLAGSLEPLFSK